MARVSVQKRSSRGIDWSTPESELYAERTVFLTGAVTDELAESVICQLAWLSRVGSQPIALVIDSPGGSVSAGLAIVDMMKGIECEVRTHALGMAASMAAIILACGQKGARTVSPLSDVLIHQPLMGGMGGQASDIALAAESIVRKKRQLNKLLAEATGKTDREIEAATDRNNRMSSEEAVAFGLADSVRGSWM